MPWDYDDYEGDGNVPGHSSDDFYTYNDQGMTLYSTIHPQSQEWRASLRDPDWYTTPDGAECLWCAGSDAEPDDDLDAERKLCRSHLAEYLGESLDSLDRAEAQAYADMRDSGYLD